MAGWCAVPTGVNCKRRQGQVLCYGLLRVPRPGAAGPSAVNARGLRLGHGSVDPGKSDCGAEVSAAGPQISYARTMWDTVVGSVMKRRMAVLRAWNVIVRSRLHCPVRGATVSQM